MSMILKASAWAAAIILVALLGAFGILPENVATKASVFLPSLAAAVLILPAASPEIRGACALNLCSKDA